MDMASPTRWAIASTGNISTDMAITLSILPKEEHQIFAVASRTKEKAQEFANKFNIPRSYGSHEEMAKDKAIDVVYLSAPSTKLYDLTSLYIQAGLNVVCEAPFTNTNREAKELVQLAKEKNVFLLEVNQTLYCPAYLEMVQRLQQGAIGTPRLVTTNISEDLRSLLENGWIQTKGAYGLMALVFGRWGITLCQKMFGQNGNPKIVANAIYTDKEPDIITVTLKYNDNCMAVINCCVCLKLDTDSTFTVYGTGGPNGNRFKLNNIYCPNELTCGKDTKTFPDSGKFTTFYRNNTLYKYLAESVRDCLLKGFKEDPMLTLDQSIQVQEIIDEIRQQIGLVYETEA